MDHTPTTQPATTVRDLYEVIIRGVSIGMGAYLIARLPFWVLDLIAIFNMYSMESFLAWLSGFGVLLAVCVAIVVLFLTAPTLARKLEVNPARPAPSFSQWSPVFGAELVLLAIGLLLFVEAAREFMPWLANPVPFESFKEYRRNQLITSGFVVVMGIAMVLFRVPIARFLVHSFRFGAEGSTDAADPTGQ